MRDLLKKAPEKNTDMEQNVRPKRKAKSRRNPIIDDSEIDDSDLDEHYNPRPYQESSSSDESQMSDNNNELEPEKPTKSSRKS